MTERRLLETFLEHSLLSTSAILIGGALAWPVSKWFSRMLSRNEPVGSSSPIWMVLFPWRAIVVTVALALILSVRTNIFLRFGLSIYVLAGISLSAASLVIGATLLTQARVNQPDTRSTSARKVASLRTLATLVAALAIPGYKGFAGASPLILIVLDLPELRTVPLGIAVVAVVAIVFDLVLGYIQHRIQTGAASTLSTQQAA